MGTPVSSVFAAQAAADANILRTRVFLNFGDYGLSPATWTSAPTAFSDQSVFDSTRYSVADLGQGIRNHRNFGAAEGGASGRGWLGSILSDGGTGGYPGVIVRNLESPNDGTKTNGPPPGGTGKRLAERAQAPTPGPATVDLKQIAYRLSFQGVPGGATVAVYSDVAGLPGVLLAAQAITTADVRDGWVHFTTTVTITAGAFFWVVLDTQTASGTDNWLWTFVNSSTGSEFAAEKAAGVWVAQTYRLHYRTTFTWAGAPTSGEYVRVSFGGRKVNRLRIYSYPSTRSVTGKGIGTFQIESGVGGVFAAVTGVTVKASDYQNASPVVAVAGNQVSSGTATFYDVLFDAVTADALRLIITKTQTVSDFARLVAMEVFFEQQIGPDRVTGVTVNARRDTFWKVDQARILDLELSNVDRFFSPLYIPTAVEVTAGFLNAELRPNLWIRVEQAFQTDEWVPLGEFYVDRISVAPKGRTATMQARDFNKYLLKRELSEQIRFLQRVEALIELEANRANFSSSRMVLDTTETAVPTFLPQGVRVRDDMEKLAQAAPLATFRFDETGVLRFVTFLPSTQTIGQVPQLVGMNNAEFFSTFAQAFGSIQAFQTTPWTHQILTDDRAYIATMRNAQGFDSVFPNILEYDVANRTFRRIKEEGGNVADPTVRYNFGNLAKDGNFLYTTRKERALKIDLTTLATTTLDLSVLGILNFSRTSTYCGIGAVVGGRYYFFFEVTTGLGNLRLGSCNAATMAGGSFVDHGAVLISGLRGQRMVRWNPTGAIDRIYFAFEHGSPVPFFTYYDLLTATLASDAVNRVGVTTDGTLLYELLYENPSFIHALQSRDSTGATVALGSQPTNFDPNNVGPCIGYAGGRIFSVARPSAIARDRLYVFYLLDTGRFDELLPEVRQVGAIVEDRTTGRLLLINQEDRPFGPFPGLPVVHRIKLRTFETPHAPVAAQFTAAYNDILLDAQYSLTDDQGGQSANVTRVRWIIQPLLTGTPVVVWRASVNGQPVSPSNRLTFVSDITLSPNAFAGPRFTSKPPDLSKYNVPFSTEFQAFPCPTATPGASGSGASVDSAGVVTFGPALSRNIQPSGLIPQQVGWTALGPTQSNLLTVTLTPHPTTPILTLVTSGNLIDLTRLEILALPFMRGTLTVVEVVSDDVFADGALFREQNGDSDIEIQNDYIGEVGLLALAAKEIIRQYGKQIHQVSGIRIRPRPDLGFEDVGRIIEPESGLDVRMQVIGMVHTQRGAPAQAEAVTELSLLLLPTISTAGLGQSATPTPTQTAPTAPAGS